MCRSFLIWYSFICQFFLWFPKQLEFYSGSNFLCLYLQVFFLCFPIVVSKFQSFILASLIHLELIFVQSETEGFSFSLLQVNTQFSPAPFVEETVFSPMWGFWLFCQKSDDCCCVGFFVNLLFYFISWSVCSCVSTMLLLLICICSMIWSQILW
jgi:hypothetical protein